MQIIITDNDFDKKTGLPTGALARLVSSWSSAERKAPVYGVNSQDVSSPCVDNVTPFPKPAEEKPAEEKPAEEKPAEEKPAEEKPAEEKPAEEKPAEEKPAELPKLETVAPSAKPKKAKRSRRTKEEIAAADDAACQQEIMNAAWEGRDPDRENLPRDTRKRVGRNPKSWIDPAAYAELMANVPAIDAKETSCVVDDASAPPAGDFSEFLDAESDSVQAITTRRFEIGNKLVQLRGLNRPAASSIVAAWKTNYNTVSVEDIPVDKLGIELAKIESALDAQQE